jgi:hypothetical protein
MLILAGCAATSPPRARPTPNGDADSLAVHALMTWAVDRAPAQAAALAEQAAAREPERPDLIWLHLRLCTQAPNCRPAPLEARLKRMAPDNGAVWLSVLGRMQAEGDERAVEQILAAMARAPRFDVYWNTLLWRGAASLHASRPPPRSAPAAPLTAALNDVTGWLSRLTTPVFEPVNEACGAARLRAPARRASCAGIAEALQHSDTYIAEGVGLGVAQRLASAGSGDGAEIERRIETLAYRNRTAGAVIAGQVEREKFSQEMLELLRRLRREQDVSLAILRWAGEPLDP